MKLFIRHGDAIVVVEGRLIILVDERGGSRVVGTIVWGESFTGLQVGLELLGETVDDCPIMQCRRVGHILGDVETRTHLVFLVHILVLVQAVEDVTSKVVAELASVLLLVKDPTGVVKAIGCVINMEVEPVVYKRASISAHACRNENEHANDFTEQIQKGP
jgi:hypothetical protein